MPGIGNVAGLADVAGWADIDRRRNRRRTYVSSDNLFKKIRVVANNALDKLRVDTAALKQGILTSRITLKTLQYRFPKMEGELKHPVASLGMISVVGMILSPSNIYYAVKELYKSYRIDDREGTALGVVNLVEAVGDGLDNSILFSYSLHDIKSSIAVPNVFVEMFVPLAVGLTAIGMMKRGMSMYRSSEIVKEIEAFENNPKETEEEFVTRLTGLSPKEIRSMHKDTLIDAVDAYGKHKKVASIKLKKKDVKPIDNMKEKKEQKLVRQTSQRVLDCMKTVKNGDRQKIADIKEYARRKIKVGYASLTASTVTLVALTILFFGVVAPYVPLALLAVSAFLRLGIYLYETITIYKGLDSFANESAKL